MPSLTSEERKVVLFLLATAIAGAGINLCLKEIPALKTAIAAGENLAKVDLNSADKLLLKSVSGIGEKLAQRILDYRKQQGGFSSLEELRNVKGINEVKFNRIKSAFSARQ